MDSDSDSGPMDSDSHLMDSDSGLMDLDSGLVDSDSLLDSRVQTHSNTGYFFLYFYLITDIFNGLTGFQKMSQCPLGVLEATTDLALALISRNNPFV